VALERAGGARPVRGCLHRHAGIPAAQHGDLATDREIEKVRLLARENGLQQQRIQLESEKFEREQIARRLLTAIAMAAVLLIATLAFLLRRNRMFRRQLQTLADRDDLTALLNRRKILALAAEALRASANSRSGLTIALLDLDHFKNFNDRYGHAFGDDVLRAFADAARRALRGADQIGRYGGEEFLVVMPDTDIAAARAVIERLRETVKKLPVANEAASRDGSAQVTLSAGLASARDGETSIEEVIRRADLALYRAKETGRDRIEILPMPA
jgi:diguanylate cyclase (GGDEF)-like protein